MRTRRKRKVKRFFSLIVCFTIIITLFSQRNFFRGSVKAFASGLGKVSAALIMPEGIGSINKENNSNVSTTIAVTGAQEKPQSNDSKKTVSTTKSTSSPKATQANATATALKVITQKYDASSANLTYGKVYVSNRTGVSINLADELKARPDINIYKNNKPQVLIIHTHATESYFPETNGTYKKGENSRSTDNSKNVIRVGDEIKKQLDAAKINTIHDKTQHDKISYNGSYDRARETIKYYLKKYPSIDVVLDIHRDAISRDNGDKVKPTATINGKKAAQIMIATGCQSGSVTKYPDWRYNLRFALRVQKACEETYPGLARPLYFVSKKYNHDLNRGSILVEMGSEANTLKEAVYSGELLGKALVKVLNGLTV